MFNSHERWKRFFAESVRLAFASAANEDLMYNDSGMGFFKHRLEKGISNKSSISELEAFTSEFYKEMEEEFALMFGEDYTDHFPYIYSNEEEE